VDDQKRLEGVGVFLDSEAKRAWEEGGTQWKAINSRIMYVKLKYKKYNVSVFSVYAPTFMASNTDKDKFYGELEEEVRKISRNDLVVILGDFNARVGRKGDDNEWNDVLGNFGVGERNVNGDRLLQFCEMNDLCITNTFFRHKNIHKHTWKHPGTKKWYLIDYILTKKKSISLFKDTRVMRSADCWTDHSLLRAKIWLQPLKRKKKIMFKKKKFNVRLFKEEDVRLNYSKEINKVFENVTFNDLSVDDAWKIVREGIISVSKEVIGYGRRKKKDWFVENEDKISKSLNDKYEAWKLKLVDENDKNVINFKKKRLRAQKVIRKAKNDWWFQEARRIQNAADRKNSKQIFDGIKLLKDQKEYRIKQTNVRDKDGKMLTDINDCLCRWTEHFDSVLNQDSKANMKKIESMEQEEEQKWMNDNPTIEEVRFAVNKMKNGKAAGMDGIVPELLKFGDDSMINILHKLFIHVWKVGSVPYEWRDSIVIPIPKKGDATHCDNNRGISLLCVAGKVFGGIMQTRMKIFAESRLLEEQCGFRSNRGTVDMIFVARQLQERAGEYGLNINWVFVDLKKAFDSVNRDAMWLVFKKYGIPNHFINLLKSLHVGMQVVVEFDGKHSPPFTVNSGVKQGCVIAPTGFGLYFDKPMRIVKESVKDLGIPIEYKLNGKLRNARITSKDGRNNVAFLLFADDGAIPELRTKVLGKASENTFSTCSTFGLTVNAKKTVTMLDPDKNSEILSVNGEVLENVSHFPYLGSILSSNGNIDKEIDTRIAKAFCAFNKLKKAVWDQSDLLVPTKIAVYRAIVISILLYAAETWTTYQHHINKLEAFHMRCLRYILNIKWSDKIRNTIVRNRAQFNEKISHLISQKRLRWLGHVERLDNNRLPKQLLFSRLNVGKSRKKGKPKLRWKDCVLKDLNNFDIDEKSWSILCKDRSKWKCAIKSGLGLKMELDKKKDLEKAKNMSIRRRELKANNLKNYACVENGCLFKASTTQGLAQHVRQRHKFALPSIREVAFKCSSCEKICKSKSGLSRHKCSKHKRFDEIKKKSSFKCSVLGCSMVIISKSGRTQHIISHRK
jgi:hypothetical protein